MNALKNPCMADDTIQSLLFITRGQQVHYHQGNLGADRLQSDRVQSSAMCAMHLTVLSQH